ncbi:MAG: N-acetylmuramoyl-L-alanine amidase [Tissierellia bacterium]|nr:N-acetylmuramoyl-L-alanine amidase [Tissierellia bacterium]
MKVIQNLVSPSKYKIKCPYTMDPEFIVVHNTANDASARDEIAYMIRNNDQISFHYAIDDKEIVQGILENRNAWHAGDGNGPGNRKGIGIEICYSKSGGKRFEEAEKLAAKFIAYKLDEKNWGVDRVKKHQDFSGKYCPHRTLDLGWQRFLNMVQTELYKLKEEKEVDKDKPSNWAKEAWDWAKKEGYLDGTRPKDPVTREELAVVLQRLVKKIG